MHGRQRRQRAARARADADRFGSVLLPAGRVAERASASFNESLHHVFIAMRRLRAKGASRPPLESSRLIATRLEGCRGPIPGLKGALDGGRRVTAALGYGLESVLLFQSETRGK